MDRACTARSDPGNPDAAADSHREAAHPALDQTLTRDRGLYHREYYKRRRARRLIRLVLEALAKENDYGRQDPDQLG